MATHPRLQRRHGAVLAAAGAVTVVQFRDAAHEADPDGALRGLTDDITADLVRELVTILPIVLVIAAGERDPRPE